MKTITLFFCDIYGTFIGKGNIKPSNDEVLNFIQTLEDLRNFNNSNKVVFSFISQEGEEFLMSQSNSFKKMIGEETIVMGRQYNESGYIENNIKISSKIKDKPSQIVTYIKELKKKYIINGIYYADDCNMYHFLVTGLQKRIDPNYYINSIIPKEKYGIAEVTRIIKNNILAKNSKHK